MYRAVEAVVLMPHYCSHSNNNDDDDDDNAVMCCVSVEEISDTKQSVEGTSSW